MKSNSWPGSLDQSPLHLLHRAGQCAARVFQSEMSGGGLTARQSVVLLAAGSMEGCSQTHLVQVTGIDRSTITDLVRRMVAKGLLQRRRSKDDARAYVVRLTDSGRGELSKAIPVCSRVDAGLLAALPTEHRDRFVSDLQRIVELLDKSDTA